MARKTSTLAAPSPVQDDNILVFEDAPEFMDGRAPDLDNVDIKVREAQMQLQQLRQQQEEIERQKQHLEALRQKQERFVSGKRDLTEKLSRAIVTLDRDLYDAQKLAEELSLSRDAFSRHLETLRSLQPEKWHRSQLDEELDSALAAIEDAEDEYVKGSRRLSSVRPKEPVESSDVEQMDDEEHAKSPTISGSDDLTVWMRRGFAFTLPLMAALLIGLILAKIIF